MLKQLAIVLAATALIACGEDAVVATDAVEAVAVEVVAAETAVEAIETAVEATETAVEATETAVEAPVATPVEAAVATGTVEG